MVERWRREGRVVWELQPLPVRPNGCGVHAQVWERREILPRGTHGVGTEVGWGLMGREGERAS